jgi:predicted dehydrogenase
MKQLLQSLKTGELEFMETPCPVVPKHGVIVRTSVSLISAGTERMLLKFGRSGWIEKGRQQPEKVRTVLDKLRTDGVAATWESIQAKLDQPFPLGYCNAGVVVEVGAEVSDLRPGDRVVSNGPHAEVVAAPRGLCAKIPSGVSDHKAAFAVPGAIALQGVRLAAPELGESFVVTGLGLLGLLAVQLLRASGCRVLGVDFDESRLALARQFGAETAHAEDDPTAAVERFSRGAGADAVVITAATPSHEPVRQAARMCRKRGRVILVGATGLNLNREDFYKKELRLQVSCSYGPGRYDAAYEEKGEDYPAGFVRWTARRNFEAVLDMMASGSLDTGPLLTHRFAFTDAARAYDLLAGGEPSIGIALEYPCDESQLERPVTARRVIHNATPIPPGKTAVSVIGAGSYAMKTLLPAFQAAGAEFQIVASKGGVSAAHAARRFGFRESGSEWQTVVEDPATNVVVIATRHDTHAQLTCEAVKRGKHVWVEKPLALRLDELEAIRELVEGSKEGGCRTAVMVGFNRRFAPQVLEMKRLLERRRESKAMILTINAGAVPSEHWTQDEATGGGRIVGEACHFVDLLRYFAGSPIRRWHVAAMAPGSRPADTLTFTLEFEDDSIGSVHYFANGEKGYPKERVEVFCGGSILRLDNFLRLEGFGWRGLRKGRLWRQDKGQREAAQAFLDAVRSGTGSPIPFEELYEVTKVTFEIAASACV